MQRYAWSVVLGLLAAGAGRLSAQSALYVEYQGKGHLVRAARDNQPCIELQGKLQPVKGYQIALKEAKDYLPALVSIKGIKATSFELQEVNTSQAFNHELRFSAEFESAYPLQNVFLLLDLDSEASGKGYFLYEIGELIPHKPRSIALTAPLSRPLGAGQFTIHLFSNGAELLHSLMPAGACERALDRMIARRVGKLQDAGPQPFIGPSPQYPDKLKKSKIEGAATIAVRITPTGAVADPQVMTATAAEFGEAALAAARLWRFIPAVRHGQAVEVKAEMPFAFKAPVEEPKQVN